MGERLAQLAARLRREPSAVGSLLAGGLVLGIALVGADRQIPAPLAVALAVPGLFISPAAGASLVLAYSASLELLQGSGPGPFATVDLLIGAVAIRCVARRRLWHTAP